LLPTLREGDIVVRDNWSSHNVSGVKAAMESVGAKVVDLPPYRPDCNPMERVFAKLKTLVRKLKWRTVEEWWKKRGALCDGFSPQECQNHFKHAGDNKKTKLQTRF
jgi:transposase